MENKSNIIGIILSVVIILILIYLYNKNKNAQKLGTLIDTATSTSTSTPISTSTGTGTTPTNTTTGTGSSNPVSNQIVVTNPNGAGIYYQQFLTPSAPQIPTYTLVTSLTPFAKDRVLTFIGQKLLNTNGSGYFYQTTELNNVTGHPELSPYLFIKAEDVMVK